MHLLARLVPEIETVSEMRAILCLQCQQNILTATNLPNEAAREFIASHYNRTDLTHDIDGQLTASDIAFVRAHDHGYSQIFPDSLLAVLQDV